jgi:hypothetical protein
MTRAVEELWLVAQGSQFVDADTLSAAVESAAASPEPLDYRTRLLIRDSLTALESYWGDQRFHQWLARSPSREKIESVRDPDYFDEDPEEIGFPSIARRVMDATKPDNVVEFFKVLSRHVQQRTQLNVGGSLALILRGLLSRNTEDADVVNEVPPHLRNQHDVLYNLAARFKLQLAHFQSHYLPKGWEGRIELFRSFDLLDVYLVDRYDVMVSKLCSKRDKDLDDLRAMKSRIDRERLKARLIDSGSALLAEERLREAAKFNWYVLFDEQLPA